MSISQRIENLPVKRFHYILLLSAGLGWMFDSMDTGIISFVLPVLMKTWGLTPEQVGNIGSIGLVGMALGAIIGGSIADRVGRKKVFAFTLVMYSIATGLCGLAWSYESLLVFRFLVGFGLGGQLPVAVTLVSEFTPAKHRGKFLVLLESFWAIGWLLAAVISYLIIPAFGWHVAFFIGAIPALYVFYLWKYIPESPRFLEENGRLEEAEAVYRMVAGEDSGSNKANLGVGTGAGVGTQEMGRKVTVDKPSKSRNNTKVNRVTLGELFSKKFLRRTVFLWLLWFGIVYSYYGIFTWLPSILAIKGFSLTKSFSYVIVMTLAQIPGYFTAAFFVDRIGRKPTLATFVLGTATSAFFFGQADSVTMILVFGSLMSFFNLGAWGILYTYTPELYPTRARGTGAGWAAGFGRIGGILAPAVVGRMLGASISTETVFLMFTGVLILVVINVLVLGEETKGRPMDEVA
ncbi:sugar phosphate permease [Desulfitobacterium dichloroeliminans LMG P-21439]|uniref:Sugar phosphate permease n=1 Tax=Desulfitobacterium dichloroeliminans (strain LMG P-21439 / DCA1) TaxID=871963 RepID=L0F4H1_DESDL|nr:MFS transporter [Desulfitobacterium dichloroeliminans]AGA68739.1 sugar phosphate permease [Desulfitobacterium dichloroeliminans LMG P-21439]